VLSIVTFVFAYKNATIRKKLNEKLSDEVYERTHELNTFLYRTSHDLAGPLARIRGLLKLIHYPLNKEETGEYLDRINLTTEKMAEVIGRLESISKINVTPLFPEKINLENFLNNIIQKIKNGYDISPEVRITGETHVTTDKNLLGHIVQNLLHNSFNHIDRREKDKKIFINVINNRDLTIVIGDTGTGIIEGHESKIFDLFFSSTDKNNRAGIGLYFASIAAKRLGGKISLKHKRKPTLFEVFIPLPRNSKSLF
jgi:signal transduction histidine kinase